MNNTTISFTAPFACIEGQVVSRNPATPSPLLVGNRLTRSRPFTGPRHRYWPWFWLPRPRYHHVARFSSVRSVRNATCVMSLLETLQVEPLQQQKQRPRTINPCAPLFILHPELSMMRLQWLFLRPRSLPRFRSLPPQCNYQGAHLISISLPVWRVAK